MTEPSKTPRTDALRRNLPAVGQSEALCLHLSEHLETELTAAEAALGEARAQSDARKTALQFAERAIEDAIYTEDGLEGEAGERVLHVVREAAERGTFDQAAVGTLGPSTLDQLAEARAEAERLREDANRYRWLREERADTYLPWIGCLHGSVSRLCGDAADAVIDAAMRGEG